jgi:uncharacterized protein YgbK (DUF1537 family)
VRDWLVAADDRTGAFEVAGLLAAVVGPVTVTVGAAPDGCGVVDLATRGLAVDEAAARAGAIEREPSGWAAHKIDSTLRGNWAAELIARTTASGRRLVVLPGWPELGRTCLGGVVHVHGEPVGRVLDHLPGAELLGGLAALRDWLGGDGRMAICDVPDTATMDALARELSATDVLVAGPGGPIGATFAPRHPPLPSAPPTRPGHGARALVVCGSANPVSRAQLERLVAARPDITVVCAPAAAGELDPDIAHSVAEEARVLMLTQHPDVVVILGGDTAAALLGDASRLVGGFSAPGMPWSRDAAGGGPLVITKAGGFGGADALVALLTGG